MANSLNDLNDHLFAQLDRLADDKLSGEQIDQEAKRAAAMVQVADKIIGSANVSLQACRLVADHGDRFRKDLPMVEGPKDPDFS